MLVSIDRYPLSLLPCTVKYWRLVTLREAVSYEEEDTCHGRRRLVTLREVVSYEEEDAGLSVGGYMS